MTKEQMVYPAKAYYVVVGLLVIAAFMLGSLFTKVQYLQSGAPAAGSGQAKAKYKSFDDAMGALAKAAKLDSKKLVACMNGGEKKAAVDAETAEGNAVGVTGTPAFLINGKLLGGAFPFDSFKEVIDKELAGTGSDKVTDYSKSLQDAAQSGAFDPKPRTVAVGNSSVRGKAGAPVTIIEFSDFQCPFCGRANPTVKQVLKEYGDKVILAYKHFPLVSIHPRAQKAAEASECAKDQGKFWEFHDQLFDNQTDWSSL
ncbi:MAG TPA: thioredoxin domain-containing protein [Patescibacteria group bacterium]|nr:thioredoxin domain-containing protein [Patescibacteria group bacterium]